MDDSRLESLMLKARPLAEVNKVELRAINTVKHPLDEKFSYIALMAPVGARGGRCRPKEHGRVPDQHFSPVFRSARARTWTWTR